MSTPAYKKALRQKQHAEAKRKKQFEAMYGKPVKSKKKKEFTPLQPRDTYQRETVDYPSLSNTIPVGACAPAERKQYTGDLIMGIATMHKSNAVPVMRGTKQAEEISQMRRN
jgi:hypothetical protein